MTSHGAVSELPPGPLRLLTHPAGPASPNPLTNIPLPAPGGFVLGIAWIHVSVTPTQPGPHHLLPGCLHPGTRAPVAPPLSTHQEQADHHPPPTRPPPPAHRGWSQGPESFCELPRLRPCVAGLGSHSFLSTGPVRCLVFPSTAPTGGRLTLLPPGGCPPGPSCVEVSPAALSQGTIHPGRLLIETMCGAAGQGGGSSGSQAWPGACGCWEG